jgi:cytochrome c553
MKPFALLLILSATLLAACVAGRKSGGTTVAAVGTRAGEVIYREDCARCHGRAGEGVAGKADEPLYGQRTVDALTRYIEKNMPEDKVGTCVGPDAQSVAAYIHEAFYSPQARAKNSPPKIDLVRLTNRQYRESLADLIGSFRPVKHAKETGGLEAEYFQSEGMNKKKKSVLKRADRTVNFDFGEGSPTEGITADQFSISWNGSLLAPDTGEYQFRLTTPNGARLYLNADLAAGDSNRRDDSDAKRQNALIDLWVSSGGMVREAAAPAFLLSGRTYPLRVDYFKFKEKTAAVKFEWKPPHGEWAVVPADVLSPESSSSTAVVGTSFPADDSSLGYERGTSVSKAWHEATTKAAIEAAVLVDARLNQLADTKDNAINRVEKLKEFCATFAERAFRRPLTPELRTAFVEQQFAPGVEPEIAVKRSVILTLKSPRFLYPELGGTPDDFTVATRLALALWDSLPDQPLLEAAGRGELRDPVRVREQARRMMQDPRAHAKLAEFFHHWLAFDEADDISKDPKAYPGFDSVLVADLRQSLEKFVEHVVWSEASDYRQLLLADYLFLNPRLAKFYDVEVPAGDDFVPVKFDPAQRAGIITHPFLLTTFSYHKSSSPIHRGVFLTRNVLGRFLKPPPMAIEFMDDRFDPSLTMREKVTELTGKPACMSCHTTINPLGFSLEHYDAVGRFRTTDNNKPINAESDYTTTDGQVLKLRGPRDLAEHTAGNPEARAGFVRQLFQHAVKQAPPAYGADTLKRLDAQFAASGTNVRGLLTEIAVTAATHQVSPSPKQVAAKEQDEVSK